MTASLVSTPLAPESLPGDYLRPHRPARSGSISLVEWRDHEDPARSITFTPALEQNDKLPLRNPPASRPASHV